MLSYFAEFSTEALMIDFFWASLLLFIGQFLRLKVKLLQNLFLPASCIAGVIGLLLSDEFFGVIGFSSQMSSYPTVLIIMLFTTLLWGPSERHGNFFQTAWSKRDSVLLQFAWGITQFSIAILVGWVLARTIFPNLDERIGVLMPAGF